MRPRGGLVDPGVWVSSVDLDPSAPLVPGLILDRDGTLVREVDHLHRPEEVELETGVAGILELVRAAGGRIGIATNQSGIDRGRFAWADFEAVIHEIDIQLEQLGHSVDAVAAAPFHPDFTPGYGPTQARYRKPGPGLTELLVARLRLDPARTWLIGDAARDIIAAQRAGIGGAIHVLTGHGARDRAEVETIRAPRFPVVMARDLIEAEPILRAHMAGDIQV